MSEGDKERDFIKNWIEKKLSELKNNNENKQFEALNAKEQEKEKGVNVDNLREESKDSENMEEKHQLKVKILLITSFVLLFIIIFLSYIIFFFESCSNLKYLYSHLEKCNGSLVSLDGVAFIDSFNFPDQGNPFYLEKDGYLIDVRGIGNVKSGERIKIVGKLITQSIVFLNVTSFTKEGIVNNYSEEKECEKNGIKVNSIENLKERGRLFVTNLTLLNYSIKTSPTQDRVFVFNLRWKETNLKSFTTSYVNKSLDINKSYKVCGIILPTTMGDILRIFLMS